MRRLTSSDQERERRLRSYREERSKAGLYAELAEAERSPRVASVLRRVAELERRQAAYWAQRAGVDGRERAAPRLRDRVVRALARLLGVRAVLPVLAADAQRSVAAYEEQPDAAAVLEDEMAVARELAALVEGVRPVTPMTPAAAIDVGREHRRQAAANGSLRAAVFGVNDGLVSNLSLVMGVAGAQPPNEYILFAGLAGLLAGAFSMAGGEYISMLSQRELLERQLEVERRHIALAPKAEEAVLAERYEERGVPRRQAREVAAHLMSDPRQALDTIAREHLGLDPEELGSPIAAATASFVAFAAGAAIPPLAFLLLTGWTAVVVSAVMSALALLAVGAAVSLFTGRHPLLSGLRMLGVGAAAAAVTFLIGHVIGVNVAG